MKKFILLIILIIGAGLLLFMKMFEIPFDSFWLGKLTGNGQQMTEKTFLESIVLHSGKTLETDAEKKGFKYILVQDENAGVFSFIPYEFFKENRKKNTTLLQKIEFLKTVRMVSTFDPEAPVIIPPTEQKYIIINGDQTAQEYQTLKQNLISTYESRKSTSEELEMLSYIYDIEGKEQESLKVDAENCRENQTNCPRSLIFQLKGAVTDSEGNPVPKASISITNKTITQNSPDGSYVLSFNVSGRKKLQIVVEAKGFTPIVQDIFTLSGVPYMTQKRNFVLQEKPIK